MQEYDFKIKYLPGKLNVVANVISRHPDLQLNSMFYVVTDPNLSTQLQQTIEEDQDFQAIVHTLKGLPVEKPVPTSLLKHYSINSEGLLLYDQT
jgi:hypothetical protein